jgi:hypothetical protein
MENIEFDFNLVTNMIGSTLPTGDDQYTFVTNSYFGCGGYKTGDYLIQFEKETSIDRRRKLIYYKNYIKGIVDSLLVPVFSSNAYRQSNNVMFDAFMGNVDNKGNGIQQFTHTVVKYARLHGVCFTVMDNFTSEDIPSTLNEAIAQRKYPYMYFKTADQVHEYTVNDFNTLETISFLDKVIKVDNKKVQTYRLWTPEYSVLYIKNKKEMKEIEDRRLHGLGVLPVISTYNDMDSDILPESPVYDLCRMNYSVYNLDNEQRNLERLCAFPMLGIQSKTHDINVSIGADSVIVYGGEFEGNISAPAWIAPPSEILTVLNSLSNEVVAKIVESSNVLGASAVNSGNTSKSGVAMSYEFLGQQFALRHTARLAERFELNVSNMLGKYINSNIEYVVQYDDNYAPSQGEVISRIDIMERLLDMNISEMSNTEIKKEIIRYVSDYFDFQADSTELMNSVSDEASLL